MSNLTYKRTHRLLKRASEENFNYHTVEIDINSGLFKKTEVDSSDTLIRVNSGVFGEAFNLGKTVKLSVKQIKELQDQFNAVRAEKDWPAVEFRTTKKVENEVSSSPQIQRQEEAETV